MSARAIMFQGTGSDVGKSLIVAGLARAYTRRGLKVRPFKPQNMSNNAAVTPDGGEIGRAQALQARAARVPLSVHMNPVLLKPQSDVGSQVEVSGAIRTVTRVGRAGVPLEDLLRKKIMGDESLKDAGAAVAFAHDPKPFGIYNIKLMKCGGIAGAMDIATIARAAGIDLFWGCNDESILSITACGSPTARPPTA